jgi:Protein of unknown function (DUF2934)
MSAAVTPMAQPDPMLEHRIRQRAHELYQVRVQGSDLQDWLQAEREVLHEITSSTGAVLSSVISPTP